MQRWTIGDVSVTLVREVQTAVPPAGMFPDADLAVLDDNAGWLRPDYVDADGNLSLSIHGLVVESAGSTILVDTCLGADRNLPLDNLSDLQSTFLVDLEAAGYPAESIDVVVCTHLHFDHVGWNTRLVDGAWVPTFTNARYLFGRIEYEYWDAGNEGAAITFGDAVRPVMEAGLAELVDTDHRITDEVWLEPTPGHSPGHVSVRISSAGADAVITGDMAHHPVQFTDAAIDWAMSADDDSPRAATTRRAFRDRYGEADVLVFGTHFGGTSSGHIRRVDGRWQFG